MMKRTKILFSITLILLILSLLLVCLRNVFGARIFSAYLGSCLKAQVTTEAFCISMGPRIDIRGLKIANDNGLNCRIEESDLDIRGAFILKGQLACDFILKDVQLSYPGSKIINGIAEALSIKPVDVLDFDRITGRLRLNEDEIVIKSLDAQGELLRVSADGTVRGKAVNCYFNMVLTSELVSGIPESVRKVFFKQDADSSEIELYITGSTDNPSINFTTDLFRLSVR